MCIYCGTNNYRKIYENHHGPIPKEDNGRSYEIHHKDNNHNNNDPANLVAVTIQEHYDIHYTQGDYGACYLIATQRMCMSPKELSELASKNSRKRLAEGTHPLMTRPDGSNTQTDKVLKGTHPWQDVEFHRRREKQRVADGTHNFLRGNNPPAMKLYELGIHPWQDRDAARKRANDRVKAGTHNWQDSKVATQRNYNALAKGIHQSQIEWCCIQCKKQGRGRGQFSQHLARCDAKYNHETITLNSSSDTPISPC